MLAGLALPVYERQTQRAYEQEAVRVLGATRASMLRFYAQNGTFVGAFVGPTCMLDYCPNTPDGGQVRHFTYSFHMAPTTVRIVAVRNLSDGGDTADSLEINQAGTITGTGIFA